MAYKYDKTKNAIVIDAWQDGIAASPYLGIANMRGLNTYYYPGVAYLNYRRQAATIAGGTWFAGTHSTDVSNNSGWIFTAATSVVMGNPVHKAVSPTGLIYILDNLGQIFKQTAVNSAQFNELENGTGRIGQGNKGLAYWNNYLVVFGAGLIEFCGLGTSDTDIISSNWNVANYDTSLPAGLTSVNGVPPQTTLLYTAVFDINIGDPLRFTTSGTLPAPLVVGVTYYTTTAAVSGGSFSISTTAGGSNITFTTAGIGTHRLHRVAGPLPLGNISNLALAADVDIDNTTGTISSYTAPDGTTEKTWVFPSGQYNVIDGNGNNLLATFTNYSQTITFLAPVVQYIDSTLTLDVNILDPNASTYKTWVSKVDGNLYFANNRNLGRLLSQNTNISFNPSGAVTYVVDYATVELLQPNDSIVDMTDLNSTLVIAGNFDLYTWDYVNSNVSSPKPVGEQIYKIINILSNINILAGTKGNIYVSNGFSSQLMYKMPDYIAGVFDPIWSWGDLMFHRSRLWFQATAQTTSGTNILSGIFSLIVSSALVGEKSQGLIMENQNSYGLTPASGAATTGILVDNEAFSAGVDSYYSGWSNGSSIGGVDYNDTSVWQNFEPVIETDIIPIGTILEKRSAGNIEFKLDRPMASGDQLKLYWRPSLSDSYVQIGGTFTNQQLSDYAPTAISQAQWAQFKVTFKGASSSSSFVPLRELTIYLT